MLRIAFVGDVSLGRLGVSADEVLQIPEWSDVMDAVGGHDLLVGNLECCLVDQRCDEHAFSERMAVPSSAAATLRDAGFSAMCLANNHMLDCGDQAIAVTREKLSSAAIDAFGAGMNLSEAEAICLLERCGRTIAFLGACDRSELYAGPGRAGIAPLEKARLGARVRDAARQADLVVVTLHADLEFCSVPAPWRQRLSRWLIEQGAHLVVQHHPHVLQGVEVHRGGLIAYSLGNFIFKLRGNSYQENRPGVFDSGVLVVEACFDAARPILSYRFVPVRIADDHFPHRVPNLERENAVQYLYALSGILKDKSVHRRVWFRRCRKEARLQFLGIYYAFARQEVAPALKRAWRLIARRHERRWLLGFLSFGYL